MKIDLSVIILSYNTKETTLECLNALVDSLNKSSSINSQVIIIDNASKDDSQEVIKNFTKGHKKDSLLFDPIFNHTNVGYTAGNNQGIKRAKGKYILFLNSDAIVQNVDFEAVLQYLDTNPQIGVLTAKVVLPSGEIDPASHRGFPSLWNSASYFLKLEKIFGNIPILNRVFGGYHLTYKNLNSEHEVDSPTGAFYLVKKHVLDRVSGFDEKNFFMYGEDIDLSYRIKSLGYKIIYYPKFTVLHYKYQSGLAKENQQIKERTKEHFYDAMKMFYHKHYERKYPKFVKNIVFILIDTKKKFS